MESLKSFFYLVYFETLLIHFYFQILDMEKHFEMTKLAVKKHMRSFLRQYFMLHLNAHIIMCQFYTPKYLYKHI
jgi:hypothetical protein